MNSINHKISIQSPEILAKSLTKAIAIKCISRVGSLWDYRYGELLEYKKIYGNCNVPMGYKTNLKLAIWISNQRRAYRKGILNKGKIKLLEDIGFIWAVTDNYWATKFEELKQFKKKYGHCNVRQGYKNNLELTRWVSVQRKNHKKGILDKGKIKLLEDIGFILEVHNTYWETNFEELKRFKNQYGHCNIPQKYKDNFKLASWVSTQRQNYKKAILDKEKIRG
jgi:hypothetical protein